MAKLNGWKTICALLVLCAATAIASPAQTFTTLVNFYGDNGSFPVGGLVQGTDGNLYGTTWSTVFEVTPNGHLTTLFTFDGPDGNSPVAALLLATNGNLYGTTEFGGAYDGGTVFKITPKGTLTTLHSFCSRGGVNCSDGYRPEAPLVQGYDGSFYGTTLFGGNSNCNFYSIDTCGTIFKINSQKLTTLYSFCAQPNCPAGAYPTGGLVLATDGNFYGTTSDNLYICNLPNNNPCGTVFKMTPSGALTTLYTFCTQDDCTDGANPSSALVQATDGSLYGTTVGDGFMFNGTVFKMTLAGALTTLYTFCQSGFCTDGANPAGLIQATDGNFYGTTQDGGPDGAQGTIFKITPDGALTTLYSFACVQGYACPYGADPLAGLVQATNGKLYGVTSQGGGGPCRNGDYPGCGTVFSLDVGLDPFVAFVRPYGRVGQTGGILGQGFTGTTSVAINGVQANFKVVSDTYLTATVPPGATTGYVTVSTPSGVLKSNVPFRVIQ